MTKVTDERLGATRFQHRLFEQVRKGSLNPDEVEKLCCPLIGQKANKKMPEHKFALKQTIFTVNPIYDLDEAIEAGNFDWVYYFIKDP